MPVFEQQKALADAASVRETILIRKPYILNSYVIRFLCMKFSYDPR
jgi:hypothetical protein